MDKTDFRKTLKPLYSAPKTFTIVEVPRMQFVCIDGQGTPGGPAYVEALSWLYGVSYAMKFASKAELGRDYVVPPLEGLWWAEDMSAFLTGDKDSWLWTMMIMAPDWIGPDIYAAALDKTAAKQERPAPDSLRLEPFEEGLSVQILHVGPYSEEGPTIAALHNEFLPENGLTETGHHHEIYLSDARRTAPEKLKTILRQPVRRI